jgi:hypothetical protein
LQFPLLPIYAEIPNIQSARIRPEHKCLEFTVTHELSKRTNDKTKLTQKLVSSKVSPNTNISVGLIRDNAMHITPLQQVLQIRPSFDGICKEEIVEDMSDEDDETNEEKSSQPLQQIRMRRKENEKAEMTRTHSYSYLKAQELAEPWVNVKIHNLGMHLCYSTYYNLLLLFI